MSPPVRNAFIFAAAATLTSIFFINLCATIFQCGCQSLWTRADLHCNVHQAIHRQCPWCRYGTAASLLPYGMMLAMQAAVSFSSRSMPAIVRLLAAAAAFPIAGTAIAVLYGLATGYWK
jgi:hypothetical protein